MEGNTCTHCHLCQSHCSFLGKYGIDIGDTVRLKELAYHCFLCRTCSAVCPVGIDGRKIILDIRQKSVEENQGKCGEVGYRLLLAEKQNYVFRNKRHIAGKSVLFPGCNFPSFYPDTTKKLIRILKSQGEMGVLFDCCGKPVAELGLKEQEVAIINRLNKMLDEGGIEEVVMVCPNCYDFLKDKLNARVVSIYEKLSQLGIGHQIEGSVPLFLPCPDREKRQWISFLSDFLKEKSEVIDGVQCCGLGGCAGVKEPELAKGMAIQIREQGYERVYTYCASCAGSLTRNGCSKVVHFLPEILDNHESADVSRSILNRMMTKFQ